MEPTPLWRLLARTLRGHCPVCARGPLFSRILGLRDYCPLCGYRYYRAIEYGAQGFTTGAIWINMVITGVVPLIVFIVIAAANYPVPTAVQLAAGFLWAALFPIVFHRIAVGLWVALDLRLNPPAPHELAAAPPRPERTDADADDRQ